MNGRILFAAGALLGGAAAFAFAENRASRGTLTEEPDVLLILGCRVRGDEAEPTLRMRAKEAARYLRAHPTVIAVPCGGVVHPDQTKSEAQAIREILIENGISDARILLEDQSKTTLENFLNARALLEKRDMQAKRIAFLSSEFHLLRAGCIGRIAGVDASSLPAPSPKAQRFKNSLREAVVFPLLLTELLKTKRKGG